MTPAGTRVVGYLRVSTAEQADEGGGLDAQKAAIKSEAERHGWVVVTLLADRGISAKSTKGRDALAAAIALLDAGGADALVVSKVDRLARSLLDFCGLMERAKRKGWAIIALDAPFDMSTPQGAAMAQVLGVFAELERKLIGQRTKEGLAAKRAAGTLRGPIGRPPNIPERVVVRIAREHGAGVAMSAIARRLNEDAIPTAQGGRQWHASTVRAVLARTRGE